MSSSTDFPAGSLPSYAVVPFLLLTFGITWSVIGGYIYFPEQTTATFGEISGGHPLYFLATWAPGIAGVVLVLAFGGLGGVTGVPLAAALLALRPGLVGLHPDRNPGRLHGRIADQGRATSCTGAAPRRGCEFMMLFLGPMEEFGWRGVAQPLLQRLVAPIWAGVTIGAAWGVWHLPAFYLAGVVYENWSFLPFFIGNVTLAILVTPIFDSACGSLVLPMLFHWQLINPFWPDAQPWDTWHLVSVAAVVVWLNRATMFTRKGAVTDVIQGEARP